MRPNKLHEKQRVERKAQIERGIKTCRVCKKEKPISEYPIDQRTGRVGPRCTKCRYAQEGTTYYTKTKNSPKRKFNTYKTMAKQRGYTFNLTFDHFLVFWKEDCTYCGERIATVGIDRVNNEIGYQIGNCVPCCETCNKMKREQSREDFIDRCRKIINLAWAS